MKLITNTTVKYNDGIVSQKDGIVIGKLISCNQNLQNNSYDFAYEYSLENGRDIARGSFTITEPEITALYDAVKGLIPTELNYTDKTNYLYYLGFRVEMAKTFVTTTNKIDIV